MTGGWGWRVTQHGVMTGWYGVKDDQLLLHCTWIHCGQVTSLIEGVRIIKSTYEANALLGIFVSFLWLRVLGICTDYMLKGDLIQVMSPQSLTVWGRGYTIGTPLIN